VVWSTCQLPCPGKFAVPPGGWKPANAWGAPVHPAGPVSSFDASGRPLAGPQEDRVAAHLAVIDVTNGTNVHVRLGTLVDGVRPVQVEGGRDILGSHGGLERVGGAAGAERQARCAQEGRQCPDSGRHCDWQYDPRREKDSTKHNGREESGAGVVLEKIQLHESGSNWSSVALLWLEFFLSPSGPGSIGPHHQPMNFSGASWPIRTANYLYTLVLWGITTWH
jgi:hypothetical protein